MDFVDALIPTIPPSAEADKMAGLAVPDPVVIASPAQARDIFRQAYRATLNGDAPNWFRMECDSLRRTIVDKESAEWKSWSRWETAVVGPMRSCF